MTENTQIFIEFNVEKFFIKNVSKTPIPCSNKNYIFAHFKFSQEWDNVEKTAVFTKDDIVCHIPIVDNKCAIPNELMLIAGIIEVSVFGGDRITTGNTILKVVESGFHDESEPPVPLDPTSVWVKSPDGSVSLVREVDGVFQYFDGDEWKNIISGDGFDMEVLQAAVSEAVQAHNTSASVHEDIRESISGLETRITNISTGGGVISGDTPYTNYISGLSLSKETDVSFKIKAGGCWDDTYTRFLKLDTDLVKTKHAWVQGTNYGADKNTEVAVPLIPKMTSNTAPRGTVTSNTTRNVNYAYCCFTTRTNLNYDLGGSYISPNYILNVDYTFDSTQTLGDYYFTIARYLSIATNGRFTACNILAKSAVNNTFETVYTFANLATSNDLPLTTSPNVKIPFNFTAIRFSMVNASFDAYPHQLQIYSSPSLNLENVYIIGKEDGTIDIMFSHSQQPALPVGFVYKRKIGELNYSEGFLNTVYPEKDLQELHFSWLSAVPDLTTERKITSFPYTIPDDGWLYSYAYADNSLDIPNNSVLIDGRQIHAVTSGASGVGTTNWAMVSKGSILSATKTTNVDCSFYLPKRR